jgi:hypothetical protein
MSSQRQENVKPLPTIASIDWVVGSTTHSIAEFEIDKL